MKRTGRWRWARSQGKRSASWWGCCWANHEARSTVTGPGACGRCAPGSHAGKETEADIVNKIYICNYMYIIIYVCNLFYKNPVMTKVAPISKAHKYTHNRKCQRSNLLFSKSYNGYNGISFLYIHNTNKKILRAIFN